MVEAAAGALVLANPPRAPARPPVGPEDGSRALEAASRMRLSSWRAPLRPRLCSSCAKRSCPAGLACRHSCGSATTQASALQAFAAEYWLYASVGTIPVALTMVCSNASPALPSSAGVCVLKVSGSIHLLHANAVRLGRI